MPLTSEEIKELKQQLVSQIQHLPAEQKAQAQKQIDEMSPEALESMLAQQQSQNQIYRSIVEGEIESTKVEENSNFLAVMEIHPISKGHLIVIPKEPITDPTFSSKELELFTASLSKKIIKTLEAKETKVIPEKKFGEVVFNIIPIYDKPLTLNSPRSSTPKEELQKIADSINAQIIEKKVEKIEIKKTRKPKRIKLKRRVP